MKLFNPGLSVVLLVLASAGNAAENWQPYVQNNGALAGVQPIDAMMVVDCLLPGQMRRSGAMSYMGPRLPVKTTAQLCAMRGGEYVAYDRASLENSLAVWMEKAKGGDAQAQFYVGQIYEKGMDTAPDYVKAAEWYKKAAASGSNEAKLSLASMMEVGHGMPVDTTAAVNLYREAMGITGQDLISQQEADARVAEVEQRNMQLRSELAMQRSQADAQVSKLQTQVAALKNANASQQSDAKKMAALESSLKEAMQQRADVDRKLAEAEATELDDSANLAQTRSVPAPLVSGTSATPIAAKGVKFGKYHALIIG
ncbi:MAG: hypothetical protein WBP53_03030, partial [Dokdonella sp.]